EKSQRGGGWDATVSRWTKTELLKPGKNVVAGLLHDPNNYSINTTLGKVVRFEIFMYNPHHGESIHVDNVRLSTAKEAPPRPVNRFQVLGGDSEVPGEVASVRELGQRLKDRWTKPEKKTLAQVTAEFRSHFAELKKNHPRAVLAMLRDGEAGYDPANPE